MSAKIFASAAIKVEILLRKYFKNVENSMKVLSDNFIDTGLLKRINNVMTATGLWYAR